MSSGNYRGRFAPSPTGPLHLGNLRTALLAWLFARSSSAPFILRVDDLDGPRNRPGSAEAIVDDLRWLGLDWDEGPDIGGPYGPYAQSRRSGFYREHLVRLVAAGAAYPCYCSRRDVALAASAPHSARRGGGYPGTCRDPERRARQRAKHPERPPSFRFRVDDRTVDIHDGIRPLYHRYLSGPADDFVVWRSDGAAAYQLAAVVDDSLMRIGEVVRGEDLLESTVLQLILYDALGYDPPAFAHVPLWLDDNGERLAKRSGSAGLQQLRDSGSTAEHVVGMLAASCGLAEPGTRCPARDLLGGVNREILRQVRNV